VTNQNLNKEEIKRGLNSDNGCYHSVQNLLSYRLLSKNLNFRIYEIINLSVVLYGFEAWSLTVREHRLRVFENWVLRRIFGPNKYEVMGGWTKLHNEELHYLYSSPSIIRIMKSRRMRWTGHATWKKEKAYMLLVGKPEGKRPLGRPGRRWVDNIKMYLWR
jgi:hypothetical protein